MSAYGGKADIRCAKLCEQSSIIGLDAAPGSDERCSPGRFPRRANRIGRPTAFAEDAHTPLGREMD